VLSVQFHLHQDPIQETGRKEKHVFIQTPALHINTENSLLLCHTLYMYWLTTLLLREQVHSGAWMVVWMEGCTAHTSPKKHAHVSCSCSKQESFCIYLQIVILQHIASAYEHKTICTKVRNKGVHSSHLSNLWLCICLHPHLSIPQNSPAQPLLFLSNIIICHKACHKPMHLLSLHYPSTQRAPHISNHNNGMKLKTMLNVSCRAWCKCASKNMKLNVIPL